MRDYYKYFFVFVFSYIISFSFPQDIYPTVIKQQYNTQNVWDFENHWQSKLFSCKPISRCKKKFSIKNDYFLAKI